MNLLDMHTIISIDEHFLNDEQCRTEVVIRYLTWDANGVAIECKETLLLTPSAQDEIVNGLKKLYMKLQRFA
jgi:hypothetical protein